VDSVSILNFSLQKYSSVIPFDMPKTRSEKMVPMSLKIKRSQMEKINKFAKLYESSPSSIARQALEIGLFRMR